MAVGSVVAVAVGVGGAKMAQGLAARLGPGRLTVVVNTADDFKHPGLHISPDIDTVMYALAAHRQQARSQGATVRVHRLPGVEFDVDEPADLQRLHSMQAEAGDVEG